MESLNNWSNKTFLIVEDNKSNYEVLKVYLKGSNVNIIWVKDGGEAVEACRQQNDIDLILMDIKLLSVDGLSAVRQIREFNTEIPIISQTAYAMASDKAKALEAGCTDYIAKPFQKNQLLKMIANYID